MSYRSDALAALDSADAETWGWFRLARRGPRRTRTEVRDLIAADRVDPQVVVRGLRIAAEVAAAQAEVARLLREMPEIEVKRANAKTLPKLRAAVTSEPAAYDANCCTALDLDERDRAALLGLACSPDRCARRELASARPSLSVAGGGGQ